MGELGRTRLMLTVYCGLVGVVGFSAAKPQEIRFTVTDQTVHQIDPRMFGQFMERPSWGEIGVEGALVPGTNRLQVLLFQGHNTISGRDLFGQAEKGRLRRHKQGALSRCAENIPELGRA